MSNSDSTSNSDSKLDALYKLTQQPDSANALSEDSSAEDTSPPDIDATILAAAREATAVEQATPIGGVEETAGKTSILSWQQRFGWATAATVLLTSVLFISLVDNEPKMGALSGEKVVRSNDAPIVQQSRYEADTDAAMESIGVAGDTYAVEQEPEITPISDRSATLDSNLHTVPQSVPASAPPSDISAFSKQLRNPRSLPETSNAASSEVIEEIVVTASKKAEPTLPTTALSAPPAPPAALARASSCQNYPKLLIGLVCTYFPSNTTQVELQANEMSACAGQTLHLPAGIEAPTPHSSSTLSRFVLQSKDAASPTEEIVCQSGKLVRQSLARGR